jgi:tetratricopeptide (TPR) repeat protein
MTLKLFILFTFTTNYLFGQKALNSKIASDACTCIGKMKKNSAEEITNCFTSAYQKNAHLVTYKPNPTTKESAFKQGQKLGEKITQELLVSMIYTCDPYFHLMDTLRYFAYKSFNKDSISNNLKFMSISDSSRWNADFYTQRGVMYFQLFDIDNALKDFDNALILNKSSFQSMYFKAWGLELQKRYDEAIVLYTNLALSTNKNEFNIFAAIAKRKKKAA